jgi:hypothetical protein
LVGAVLGAVLGLSVQVILPMVLKDFLPFEVDFFVSWPAVGKGMLAGLVICLLFTLLPLLAAAARFTPDGNPLGACRPLGRAGPAAARAVLGDRGGGAGLRGAPDRPLAHGVGLHADDGI